MIDVQYLLEKLRRLPTERDARTACLNDAHGIQRSLDDEHRLVRLVGQRGHVEERLAQAERLVMLVCSFGVHADVHVSPHVVARAKGDDRLPSLRVVPEVEAVDDLVGESAPLEEVGLSDMGATTRYVTAGVFLQLRLLRIVRRHGYLSV